MRSFLKSNLDPCALALVTDPERAAAAGPHAIRLAWYVLQTNRGTPSHLNQVHPGDQGGAR